MSGFDNEVVHAVGIDLSGGTPVANKLATDGFLYIGSTSGNPVAALPTATDSTLIVTAGSGTLDFALSSPVSASNGGTGSTSFTAGSVVFSNGSILTQDNSNLFWDDTNNRLGIGTVTPLDELDVVGSIMLTHTSAEADDHAIEIDCNAAGFGDVKALDINYITGALAAGDDEECILVNIDESASSGGEISGYQVLSTAEGSATIHGYVTGINVNPILHNSGTFGDADDILNKAVDVTAALASGGAGSISGFVADDDTMTYGDAAQFNEMEVILGTGASAAGIAPIFAFSTGGTGFTNFAPSDGTNGMRNSGAILWIAADLSGWVANATGFFEIRITRTRNNLNTTPILDEVQISSATEYTWNKDGDLVVNSIALTTPLDETDGGTGQTTITAGDILYGSAANVLSKLAKGSDTEVLTLAAGIPSWAAPTVGTVTSVSGTASRISSTGGATPVIDIDAAYVGQASITTLGTITTGVWTGTTVAVANGGTGATTFTDNALLRGQVAGALSPSTVLVSDNGEMTNPSQPAFMAFLASVDSNVTGDGTNYTLGGTTALTEVFDQNSDFTTAGVLTSPVSGRYALGFFVLCQALVNGTNTPNPYISSSNRLYFSGNFGDCFTGNNAYYLNTLADMDAADIASVIISIAGGTKIVDIFGAATDPRTCFYGHLVC